MSIIKSDYIRRVYDKEKNLDMPAPDVVDLVAKQGIQVTTSLVYLVRNAMRAEQEQEQERRRREEEKQRQKQELERVEAIQAQAQAERRRQAAANAEVTRQVKEQLQMERKQTAAKVQRTKTLNTKPLHQYVREALSNNTEGMTNQQVADAVVALGYKSELEHFVQAVRKVTRLMAIEGELLKDENNVLKLVQPVTAPSANGVVGHDMIDPKLLVEVNKLVQRVGGKDRLSSYIATLEELQAKS